MSLGELVRSRPQLGPSSVELSIGLVLSRAGIPVALMALAMFLRLYNMEQMGWVPDTYERLLDAHRIASGELPNSKIYAPGASALIAPFFLVLPDSLATMQAAIISSGVALVGLSYVWMMKLTQDRFAAFLAALAAAATPIFVAYSRDGFFDMISLFMIAAFLFATPSASRKGLLVAIGYGVLLALLVNTRPTGAAILPPLLLLWLYGSGTRFEVVSVIRSLQAPSFLLATGSFVGMCVLSVLLTEWATGSASPGLTGSRFVEFAIYYFYSGYYGLLGVLVLPLSIAGLAHMWRTQRVYALVFIYILVAWPLAHAPFPFANIRYMLPVMFALFFVASMGASRLLRAGFGNTDIGRWRKALTVVGTAWCLAILGLQFAIGSGSVLADWHNRSSESDAGMAREFEPLVRDMEPDSLLVSAVTRAFWDSNDKIARFDLVDHHIAQGTGAASLALLTGEIEEKLDEGGKVYYLASHWEAGHDFLGRDGEQGYGRFFDAIDDEFALTELMESEGRRVGLHRWILYSVEANPPPDSP